MPVDLKIPLSTTTKKVLPANPNRVYALLVNDGTDVVRLGLGKAAESGRGPRLNTAGSNFEINLTNPFKGEIQAISQTGTPDICITEW